MSCFVNRIRRKQERREALEKRKMEKLSVNRDLPSGTRDTTLQEEVYVCRACGLELFEADKKFDSGTGFPSFWMHIGENVREKFLDTYGRERIQLLCRQCGQHLGHLFSHKKTPTGIRYCINASSLTQDKK